MRPGRVPANRAVPDPQEEQMSIRRRKAAYAAAAAAAAADGPTGFLARIASIPRLARDVLTGRYDGMSRGRLMLLALAALYLVSPIDLASLTFVPLVGILDDTVIAAWVITALVAATSAYAAWLGAPTPFEAPDPRVVAGEVVRQ
jgi:uncharacterized membrane protein YkvA (DUF1232 family)